MNVINLNENNGRDAALVITTNKLNELGQLPYSKDRDAALHRGWVELGELLGAV